MRETRTFTIKDCRYEITQMGAYKSLTLLHILSRVTAPAIRETVVENESAAFDALGDRIGGILERLSEKDMRTVIDTLAGFTRVTLPPDQGSAVLELRDCFDEHFAGPRLGDLLLWLVEALKFNFSDFLAGLSALLPTGASSSPDESSSPPS